MAPIHEDKILQGVDSWNTWRLENPAIFPDLSNINLSKHTLKRVNFRDTNLSEANLESADISEADFCHANLSGANLTNTNFFRTDLFNANLCYTNLSGTNLEYSIFVETDMKGAVMRDCQIYGISVWNLKNDPLATSNLIINCPRQLTMTVENLEVAQFIYLMLDNRKIKDVIDTVTSKVVLILGRFSKDRKPVLDEIKRELQQHDFSPILFDFDAPKSKDLSGTIEILARLARFVIVDITDPSSVPHELALIVPFLRKTPIIPIQLEGTTTYSMFTDLTAYPWVHQPYIYTSDTIMSTLSTIIKSLRPLTVI